MKDGESVLIHAGGSGVGTAAVQLARHVWNSTKIFVTAGHQDKIDYAKKLGADDGFNYKEGNFAEKLLAASKGEIFLRSFEMKYAHHAMKCENFRMKMKV
jgi:tumor protein p53-inducible protein 3